MRTRPKMSPSRPSVTTSTAGTPLTTSASNLTQYQNIFAGGITYKYELGPVATVSGRAKQ